VSKQATCGVLARIKQCTDRSEIVRLMQRRERNERFEHGQHLAVHHDRLPVTCAAVDHPMPGGENSPPSRALREHVDQKRQRLGTREPWIRIGLQLALARFTRRLAQ
jgi:hypothetical protein